MCNLYSLTKGQAAIRDWFRASNDRTGNLPLFPGIFPDLSPPNGPRAECLRSATSRQRAVRSRRCSCRPARAHHPAHYPSRATG